MKDSRQESFHWAHQFIRKREQHKNMLTEKFQVSYPKLAVVDPKKTPVNILCLDGGGMRGMCVIWYFCVLHTPPALFDEIICMLV